MVMVLLNALDGFHSGYAINDYINYSDDDDEDDVHDDVDDVVMTMMKTIIICIITMAILLMIIILAKCADMYILDARNGIWYYYIMDNWPTKLWREFGYCLWQHIVWYTVTSLNGRFQCYS